MSIIDYTGKLNNHEEYIKILNKVEPRCKYIEIVVIDERKTNELVDKFKNDIKQHKKVTKWWGTETKISNNLYRIKATKEFFSYLTKFETFCKYFEYGSTKETLIKGDYSEITNFGYDDIAFYDENDDYILFTTTHEGNVAINDKIL